MKISYDAKKGCKNLNDFIYNSTSTAHTMEDESNEE